MSEIPFVDELGDELDRSARRTQRAQGRSRRRRRLGALAMAGTVLVSGTALATGLLAGDVDDQARAAIACYDGADPENARSVAVIPRKAGSAEASPVTLCRRELGLAGQPVPSLVACGTAAAVAVIPGRGSAACTAAGLAPLDPGYRSARVRVAKLERAVLAIEASADCVPPGELVGRVQRLLDRVGWTGWRVEVASGAGDGRCGSVSRIGGDGQRYVFFDTDARRVSVARSASRRVTDLLYAADRSLLAPLFDASGARCFTLDGLVERVRRVFGAKGIEVSTSVAIMPRGTSLDDEDGRWTRYEAGCAVLAGGSPGRRPGSVEVQIFRRP